MESFHSLIHVGQIVDECNHRQQVVFNFRAIRACHMGRTKWLPQNGLWLEKSGAGGR
jgi:hypothetical protein